MPVERLTDWESGSVHAVTVHTPRGQAATDDALDVIRHGAQPAGPRLLTLPRTPRSRSGRVGVSDHERHAAQSTRAQHGFQRHLRASPPPERGDRPLVHRARISIAPRRTPPARGGAKGHLADLVDTADVLDHIVDCRTRASWR